MLYEVITKDVLAEKLAALVLNESVKRANVNPEEVDEVVLSQSYANGETQQNAEAHRQPRLIGGEQAKLRR